MAHVLHVNSVVDGVDPWGNAADMITFATWRDPLSLYLIFPLYRARALNQLLQRWLQTKKMKKKCY